MKNFHIFATPEEAEEFGVDSDFNDGVPKYHVDLFFDEHPNGQLYIYVGAVPDGAHDFSEIDAVYQETNGRVKLYGIYTTENFSVSMIATIQAKIDGLWDENCPSMVFLAANLTEATSALVDLSTAESEEVCVVIGQDGGNVGASLFASTNKSITCLGNTLAIYSKSQVHISGAWIDEFNVARTEFDKPALANGDLIKSLSGAQLDAISNKKYIFLYKRRNRIGTYYEGSWTASNGDYGAVEDNRPIQKMCRLVDTVLTGRLGSPIYVSKTTGKLSPDSIKVLENLCNRQIEFMEKDREISGFRVYINPDQDVSSTGEIEVAIGTVEVATVRTFKIKLSKVKNI